MRLSENLTLQEVIKSRTAISNGLSNEPTIEALENLKQIAENIFQPLRKRFGVPIGVTSGYRSKELNTLIGGSKTSQHMKGEALDIDAHVYGRVTNKELFNFILDHLVFDQLIWEFGTEEEPAWVHVSYKKKGNRGEVLQALKSNGKTIYKRI